MPIETRTHLNAPVVVEKRTEYKVADDRSIGEKAMDALNSVVETVKDALTPEVTNRDIAEAAMEHQELRKKEEIDRRRAEGASARQAQLEADAQRLQDRQFAHKKEELKHASKADKQAQKVAKLQNKQAEQRAEKCHDAMKKQGACHGDVKVTRVTEIH